MGNKKSFYIWFILVLFTANCMAFIYDVHVMRKWDSANNRHCYFVGLGDFHDKKHAITPLQLNQIDQIIKKLHPNKTKLIIEDISSADNVGKRGCGRFCVNSRGGILGGLVQKFRGKNFPYVNNIEYRFCRVAALAPVINNVNTNFRKFLSTTKLYKSSLNTEVASIAKEILSYNDGIVLNNWYKKCLSKTYNNMKVLKFDKKTNMSIADFIYSMTTPKNRLNFIKKLLMFDTSLVDARIVHSIVTPPSRQHALVIAGGSHIKNVSGVLQQIGYKPVYRSKIIVVKERASKNCPGHNLLPGGFCRKPKPADLRILNRFF